MVNGSNANRSKDIKAYKKKFFKIFIGLFLINFIGCFTARDFLIQTADDYIDAEYDSRGNSTMNFGGSISTNPSSPGSGPSISASFDNSRFNVNFTMPDIDFSMPNFDMNMSDFNNFFNESGDVHIMPFPFPQPPSSFDNEPYFASSTPAEPQRKHHKK